MNPQAIQLNLVSRDRDSVLHELVQLVPGLQKRPNEATRLLEGLIEREEMHSTGIGDGLALPHTRNNVGGLVMEPLIVFGRHAKGIDYGAIDSKPVQLFFLLLTTSITQHLHVLARMSRILRNPELRSSLLIVKSPADAIHEMQRWEG
ncbi:MAG: hypothetical protein RI897_3617 [Verrucomicrobiota bacterium]|jgi:mannitol/fructose-specific phosphotransferase system IIA component (Ntr-type)